MDKTHVQQSSAKTNGNQSTHVAKARSNKKPSTAHEVPARSPSHLLSASGNLSPTQILHLQRTLGNHAVGRLIQAKLTISHPGDPYEREADRVADTVMRMAEPEATEEEVPQVQAKPLVAQITPLVQRTPAQPMEMEEEEEKTVAPKALVQRVPVAVREDDEEEKVAPKLEPGAELQEEEEGEAVQAKVEIGTDLQRQTKEDEKNEEQTLESPPLMQRQMEAEEKEAVQTKPFSASLSPIRTISPVSAKSPSLTVQRLCTECEDDLARTKPIDNRLLTPGHVRAQRKEGPVSTAQVTPSVSANIHALHLQGGGSPLSPATRTFFEPRFGADFGQVRVHTGARAEETAKSINARAFTVGRSIAFGAGQYAPASQEGRHLLAHELTHVVQQNGEQLQTTGGAQSEWEKGTFNFPLTDLKRTAGNSPTGALLAPRANVTVQRGSPGSGLGTVPLPSPGDPFGLLAPKDDQLRFTNRSFPKLSLPTVCPSCHDTKPIGPQLPQFVDRDATEPRLVTWGTESDLMLHHGGSVRILQLVPNATDTLVDDYGVGLTKRITSSHEFEGSDAARVRGADTIRLRWGDIRPPVRNGLTTWYRNQLMEAVAMTPKWASPVLDPNALRTSLASHYGERAPLGRWDAVAVPGQKYGVFEIDDIGLGQVWFHLPGRPLWRYQISQGDFIRHDPFVAAVAEQVYDSTKWILQVMPFIMKVGAFALGFSGSVAVIIAAIVLDELATEMQADAEGRPGRSVEEILGSGATQLIVDRIFHGLLGGGAGRAAAGLGKSAARIEKIAESAVPAIRRELVQIEKPLVKQALEAGTARKVTDEALKAEGHVLEVAVEAAGESHIFRLNRKGAWCRFTKPICELDLGADIATAAKSPSSFTTANLADTRALIGTVKDEISFLGKMYERMRAAGRVDMALLSKEERALLDQLAPSGDAAKLSLRELRDLPKKLGLERDVAGAFAQEAKLIKQLYREGRPLYEIMRVASPSFAARSRVLGEAYGRDAATGIAARSGALEVDHVVPLNDIVRMSGFDKLRPERQLEIVNDVKNLRAIDSLANSSRGDRSWWSWAQAQIHYDFPQIAKMRALENELRIYVEGRIRVLSRP